MHSELFVSSGFTVTMGHQIEATVGKYFLKAQLCIYCSASVCKKKGMEKRERERVGGHSVDKADLFLIYVLL